MIGGTAGAVGIVSATVVTGWAVALCVTDLRWRRLPDQLTLPAIVVTWLAAACHAPLALFGGLGWAGLYLVLAVVSGGVGGGDIKLAASLGVLVVWAGGVTGLLVALLGAALLSLGFALVTGRATVPHGPAMLASALLGAVAGAVTATTFS